MDSKRLVIVDGYSLLYRAFFATRFLSTSDGRPTNALHGFLSMVFNLLETQKPEAIVVALDAPGKTFRHAEYAEYKGTRRETADELKSQMVVVRDLIKALAIPSLELTGYEADDVVGTISRIAEQNGYRTTIVTGDLDQLQLVDPFVTVMTPKVGVSEVAIYDPASVMDRYGFSPEHIPDYKALVGDPSDNIPGVPGVGDKTASKLIQQYGTIEKMLAECDQMDEKMQKRLQPHTEQLKKSKWLATINCDVPITFDFEPYRISREQFAEAQKMLEWLEFRNHLKRLPLLLGPYIEGDEHAKPIAAIATEPIPAKLLPSARNFDQLRDWVDSRPYSIVMQVGKVQESMFDDEEPSEAYIAIGSDVRKTSAGDALRIFRMHPDWAILHDSKSLYNQAPGVLTPPRFDASLAGYVLQSGRSAYALRDLAQGYLDITAPDTPEQQASALFHLEAPMRERLEKENQLNVLDDIELPLVPILSEMELHGICVSRDYLEEFSKTLQVTIDQTAKRIYEMAGCEFLIGSPKQLGEVLFERLGIPGAKKTKTGYATGAEVLQVLAPSYPICSEILSWRELTKLKSTYADALPKMIAPDGRIHTRFNQTVAATGRLSSNEPNLQNIPIRTELGRHIRKAFISAPGYTLGSFDYSQIELRLLAHLCRDQALLDAFQDRTDVHTITAALMFNVKNEDVSKEQRRLAKMLNYAVLYGVTDYGLANQLGGGFSVAEAKALITHYFERFPSVKQFTEDVVAEARSKGFTTTLTGRRRYFPDIHSMNRAERLGAERQAVNAPIQGTAADMIKIAMIQVRKLLGDSDTKMLLQVHDELVFEMADDKDSLIEPIRHAMETALELDVPIEVDAKLGSNWDEMRLVERP